MDAFHRGVVAHPGLIFDDNGFPRTAGDAKKGRNPLCVSEVSGFLWISQNKGIFGTVEVGPPMVEDNLLE